MAKNKLHIVETEWRNHCRSSCYIVHENVLLWECSKEKATGCLLVSAHTIRNDFVCDRRVFIRSVLNVVNKASFVVFRYKTNISFAVWLVLCNLFVCTYP